MEVTVLMEACYMPSQMQQVIAIALGSFGPQWYECLGAEVTVIHAARQWVGPHSTPPQGYYDICDIVGVMQSTLLVCTCM